MRSRTGVVLFIVVIVVALVSLAAYSFAIMMRTEVYSARLRGDQVQAQTLTESGLTYVNSWADASRGERDALGGLDDNAAMFRNVLVDRYVDPLRPGCFSIVRPSSLTDGLAEVDQYSTSFGATTAIAPPTFGVVDESSKLHLQTVLAWETEMPGAGRFALMALPGMTESIADAILDWIDEDSEVREFGAEDDYYSTLNPSREPANRVPRSLDQLLRVRGVTNELLFGFDRNRNYRIENMEQPHVHHGEPSNFSADGTASSNGTAGHRIESGSSGFEVNAIQGSESSLDENIPDPWCHFLTVTSAEKNVDYFGRERIFLNDKSLIALHRKLEAAFGAEVANFIVAIRQHGFYDGPQASSTQPIPLTQKGRPAEFEIPTLASLVNAQLAIEKGEKRTVYKSPWHGPGSPNSEASFATFCDAVTLDETRTIVGRISVMSAPRQVLTAIPELTAEQVDRIVAARGERSFSGAGDNQGRRNAFWLVEEEIVDVKTFEQVSQFLTTGGDVLSAQVVGYYPDASPNHRIEVIVDGTDQSPRPVYYCDLTRLGRGFTLDQLALPADVSRPGEPTPSPSTNGIVPGEFAPGR